MTDPKCPHCGGTVGRFGDNVGCTEPSNRFDEEDGCGWYQPIVIVSHPDGKGGEAFFVEDPFAPMEVPKEGAK